MPEYLDGTGGTDPTATPPGTDWEKEAQKNLSRYNGMNGKFQELQNRYAALEGQQNAVAQALTNANGKLLEQQKVYGDLDTQFKTATQERDTFMGKHKEAESAAATAAKLLDRLTLITTDDKYRDLTDFWPLIKELPGEKEDFVKNLDLFSQKLAGRTQAAVQNKLTGATGSAHSAPQSGAVDKETAYANIGKLIDKGITSGPEYEAALNEWMAAGT